MTFRDDVGKRIKRFVLCVIQFIDTLPRQRTCDVIGKQLIRSGASIGANFFEARAARSRRDYANFFNHALKSANESIFWLETLIEAEKCDIREAMSLLEEARELARILGSSVRTLRNKR